MPGTLRLIRGASPAAVLRRLLVAGASAGVCVLLLAVLGQALRHPGEQAASVTRLAWCAVPFAAALQWCVAVARVEPGGRPQPGLRTLGVGPLRPALVTAAGVAAACLVGSGLAWAAFLLLPALRGGLPLGAPLPVPGVLTLLLALPLTAAVACAAALVTGGRTARAASSPSPAGVPPGLPWGAALTAAGLAWELYTAGWGRPPGASLVTLPAGLGRLTPPVLIGWVMTAIGLVLAARGLVRCAGQLLAAFRPGALRLLAGRALQEDAVRVGRPLGVLCAVTSATLAATGLHAPASRAPGLLTGVGAALLLLCPALTALSTAAGIRDDRRLVSEGVLQQGASPGLLRAAVALRAGAAVAVLVPATLVVAHLAALPLTP